MKKEILKSELLPESSTLTALLSQTIKNPHAILGMHYDEGLNSIIVRCYDPFAVKVEIIADNTKVEMIKILEDGLFAYKFPRRKKLFDYTLEKTFGDSSLITKDPYSFLPGLGDLDLYLFNKGEHQEIYNIMGAKPIENNGTQGVLFSVWGPNAEGIAVVGDFNCWDGRRHLMRQIGSSGIWDLFIPCLKAGDKYKFEIKDKSGNSFLKLDPYAFQVEKRPNNAGIITEKKVYSWSDDEWMHAREKNTDLNKPVNVYEVHLASWRGPGLREIVEEEDFHNYRELAHALADYVIDMGYTHIELLPIAEHPLDQSWGYQITGFFAPTSRYGTPDDFAYFVNHFHNKGIGVILDWVPAHFPKDAFSLGRFDGSALYEHADPKQGEHRDWGTYIFNYGRCEVRNFLISNALYWLDYFHIDGLRVDAVASMLYLDYSKEDGDWIPNEYGGNENLDAISFLKELNEITHKLYPGILMIAEESTAWPMVSRPVYLGGLGFDYKWNMGWMHDSLEYYQNEPIFRSYHHGVLTFSLLYAHSENYVLPFSHDEVVHGKKSLLDKMPGDPWQKFANLRALYSYMMTHPGKKLLFMGGEIAQWTEWNSDGGLDWNLLEYNNHKSIQNMIKDLNQIYKDNIALWENDFSTEGFAWIDGGDFEQSIVSYIRWDKNKNKPIVTIINLTPVVRNGYTIGVPKNGNWEEIFNSDNIIYGGSNVKNENVMSSKSVSEMYHGQMDTIQLTLPPLGAVVLRPC